MKASIIVIFTLVAVLTTNGQRQNPDGLDCITLSTTPIIWNLCYNGKNNYQNQALVDDLFACHDKAPGKAQFVKCQTQRFGSALDNLQTVKESCNWDNLSHTRTYMGCLSNEFKAAGLNVNSAVPTLNKCQAKVLGMAESTIRSC